MIWRRKSGERLYSSAFLTSFFQLVAALFQFLVQLGQLGLTLLEARHQFLFEPGVEVELFEQRILVFLELGQQFLGAAQPGKKEHHQQQQDQFAYGQEDDEGGIAAHAATSPAGSGRSRRRPPSGPWLMGRSTRRPGPPVWTRGAEQNGPRAGLAALGAHEGAVWTRMGMG